MSGRRFKFHPDMRSLWADYGQWSSTKVTAANLHVERRHGCRWNDAESRHLLGGYLSEGRDIPSLASRHRRGVNGITSQLNRLMGSPAKHALMLQLWSIEMAEPQPVPQPLSTEEIATLRGLLDKAAEPDFAGLERRVLASMVTPVAPYGTATGRTGNTLLDEVAAEVFKQEFQTSPPRPYAHVIHAYADGKPVQWRPGPTPAPQHPWVDYTGVGGPRLGCPAHGVDRWEWRVKPALTVARVWVNLDVKPYILKTDAANLELTFDDEGRLTGARVL